MVYFMDKEHIIVQAVKNNIKDNLKIVKKMVTEHNNIMMEAYMKENLKIVVEMVME